MLNLNWQIVFNLINILIFYLFLKRFLFKPINAMLDKRAGKIKQDMDDAQNQRQEADALVEQYEQQLQHAKEDAAQIIKEARERADREYERRMKELEETASKYMEDSRKVIELEREKSIQEAQDEIAAVAILATGRILGKNVDNSTNQSMLNDFIKEVGAAR